MNAWNVLGRAAGLTFCMLALSTTALADPGKGNGNGPGATPPGQEKKAEPPAATPVVVPAASAPLAAPSPEPKAEKKAAKAERKAEKKAAKQEPKTAPSPAATPRPAKKAEKAAKAEAKREKAASKPAKAASPSKGQSANAHHHVIICHRTGSLSNPYVVINIPYTAWLHAHSPSSGAHPAKNGHVDILLKDPASRPGSKDGFTKSACGSPAATATPPAASSKPVIEQKDACPAATATTERVLVGVWHATGAYKNGERKYVFIAPSHGSAHYGKHEDDKPVYETRTVTRPASGESCGTVTSSNTAGMAVIQSGAQAPDVGNPAQSEQAVQTSKSSRAAESKQAKQSTRVSKVAPAPTGNVAGAVSPVRAKTSEPAGGLLGAVASAPKAIAQTATTGTLPFTGMPLWIAALIGGALLATGIALRRNAA